jgi:hypothetical protein
LIAFAETGYGHLATGPHRERETENTRKIKDCPHIRVQQPLRLSRTVSSNSHRKKMVKIKVVLLEGQPQEN